MTPPLPSPADVGRRWVVRHACAGVKGEWDGGADDDRPLDPAGVEQARALAAVLAREGPLRLVASPTRRCIDTLAPIGEALDLPVEVEPALRAASGVELARLLAEDRFDGAALCTHGEVMTPALTVLRSAGLEVVGDRSDDELVLKGAAWRLDRAAPGWRLDLVAPMPLSTCPRHRSEDPD